MKSQCEVHIDNHSEIYYNEKESGIFINRLDDLQNE